MAQEEGLKNVKSFGSLEMMQAMLDTKMGMQVGYPTLTKCGVSANV